LKLFQILTGIGYPFLVYAGLTRAGPRMVAITLAVMLALQATLTWSRRSPALVSGLLVPAAALGVVLIPAALFDEGQFFLLVPVLVNAVLLIAFGRTLLNGPSMVESFARLRGRQLPTDEIAYCRIVTVIWCLFFALNGGFTLWLALYRSLAWWTLYTGLLAYLLIGALFATEMVYRYWRFRPYDGSVTDPLFRRIFPPRGSG
jgi:uncharacterized membrane protein